MSAQLNQADTPSGSGKATPDAPRQHSKHRYPWLTAPWAVLPPSPASRPPPSVVAISHCGGVEGLPDARYGGITTAGGGSRDRGRVARGHDEVSQGCKGKSLAWDGHSPPSIPGWELALGMEEKSDSPNSPRRLGRSFVGWSIWRAPPKYPISAPCRPTRWQ